MPKRKRATSEGCCAISPPKPLASLPLTTTNLEQLQQALSPSPNMARTASPSRTTSTLDARDKLAQYRIHVDSDRPLPPALQRHISDVILKPRDGAAIVSPNAKKIVQRRRLAAQQNETTGSQMVVPYMLFTGEADMDERGEAVPLITRKAELLLNRYFLPPAPNHSIKETWKELSQPKPDSCIGYVSRSDAAAAGCDAPFSADEEAILNDYVLTKSMYMPFLTGQWKSPTGAEGLHAAQSQAARDGAVAVNHLYDLYHVAHGAAPSPVDICHFSAVGDLQYGEIWVHWREDMDHYMELVHAFPFRDQAGLEKARGFLRNIKDFAITERLQSIQNTLKLFAEAKNRSSSRYPAVPASVSSATMSNPSRSAASVALQAPPTPSSVASEPVKKRRRVDGEEEFGRVT